MPRMHLHDGTSPRETDMRNENGICAAGHGLEHDDRTATPPAGAEPGEKDEREKRKHPASENELPSTQEKNPIPPGTTQRSSRRES